MPLSPRATNIKLNKSTSKKEITEHGGFKSIDFINLSTANLPRVKGLSVALGPREYECGSLDIVSSNHLRKSFLLARSLLFLENMLHGPGGFPANLVLSGFCVGEGSYCLTWRWRSLGDHENYR